MSDLVRKLIGLLADGDQPTQTDILAAFEDILSGRASPVLIAAFLMGLRTKGESIDDIEAAARVMRGHARSVEAPEGAIDTCGTGGLPFVSLNTSTAAALVVAGAGGIVAKHGNRSVPPKTGSADVLEALGVNLDIDEDCFSRCLQTARVGFMFAQAHHSAMKHVAPVRKELGIRTIFNLLGPLSNPAGTKFQVLGVFSEEMVQPLAQVLHRLGVTRAWVVHGRDGLDEISVSDETLVAEATASGVTQFVITPEEVGLQRHPQQDLVGGDPQHNAEAILKLLNGAPGAFRDIVALNAGASLFVSGQAETLKAGVNMAQLAIDDGRAQATLQALITTTNEDAE